MPDLLSYNNGFIDIVVSNPIKKHVLFTACYLGNKNKDFLNIYYLTLFISPTTPVFYI